MKLINYVNQIIHNCIILEPVYINKKSSKDKWRVRCHCGKIFICTINNLKRKTTSCGCIYQKMIQNNLIDYTNKKYNNCTIIKPVIDEFKTSKDNWYIKCDCGKIFISKPNLLQSNRVKSCGCYKKQCLKNRVLVKQLHYYNFINKYNVQLLEPLIKNKNKANDIWIALCNCGIKFEVNAGSILYNITKSCGCKKRESSSNTFKKYHELKRIKRGLNKNFYIMKECALIRNLIFQPIRNLILQLDMYTCNLCLNKKLKLNVHHIIPFNENFNFQKDDNYFKIYDINNLITLCKDCHIQLAHDGQSNKINKDIQQELQIIVSMRYVSKDIQKKYNKIVKDKIQPWIEQYIENSN